MKKRRKARAWGLAALFSGARGRRLEEPAELIGNVCRRNRRHAGVAFLFAARTAAGTAGVRALDEEMSRRERPVDGGARRAPEGERRRADGLGDVERPRVARQEQRGAL